jgi:hypothetical protein
VEAILCLSPPKNKRQLRHFLGMVNYYRDMWKRRSHILASLTGIVGANTPFVWGVEQQKAFEEMKRIISRETLLNFPDFEKEFHIYTDASKYQLGAVIAQDNKPIAFYSRKLNSAQKHYTTGEQELLSIVETLKEFRNILLGQKLIVNTDHMNILYGNLPNDRITRWRLLLEEYGPEFVHVSGKENIVADALSRMEANSDVDSDDIVQKAQAQTCACALSEIIRDAACVIPESRNMEAMAEALLSKKEVEEERFPMSPRLIAKEQKKDNALKKSMSLSGTQYKIRKLEGEELITYEGRIVIPKTLQERIIAWYHEYLAHPGMTRMEATLRSTMTWPNMRKDIEQYVRTCRKCQLNKQTRKKYGELPLKQAEPAIPWNRVDIDMIGPLKVKAANGTYELMALTMIDPATGWFEVKDVPDQSAASCQAAFDDVWLSRYPRPE